MPSTRDPILLLEPSNLLEPLNLADRYADPAGPPTRPERDVTSPTSAARPQSAAAAIYRHDGARGERLSVNLAGSQPIKREYLSTPIARDGRWRIKSALLVAGALACVVATGTALPQLVAELTSGDVNPSQQATPAQQQAKPAQQTVAGATTQPAPAADAPIKSEESKPTESKPNEPSGSNQGVALTANTGTQPPVTDPPAPAAQESAASAAPSCGPRNKASDDKCLEGGVQEPAPATARTAVPDRSTDGATARTAVPDRSTVGAPAPSRTTGASPTKPRAAPQTIWDLDDRAQQPVNRRTTPRDTADQQAPADSNGQSARSSDSNSLDRNSSDRSSWDRDRRQDQDSSRSSSRRRERSGDNGQTARYGDSRQEQDVSRSSNWRRDRQDEYAREDRRGAGDDRRVFGDDRRVFSRAPREDDRVIGGSRVPREDDRVISGPRPMGPIPILPSLFGW
jgi:hypothetical protein